MTTTQNTNQVRYCCKNCGAESPTGIGYVVNAGERMPETGMKAWCEGPHA